MTPPGLLHCLSAVHLLLAMRANPKLRTSELAAIPERPQFQLSDAYRASMSTSPTAQRKTALVEGSSSVSGSPRLRALPSARRRMRELQNGKTQLQATHVNFNPIFREAKPLSLSSDASAAAALRTAPRRSSLPPGGPAASSGEPGDDEGADNNQLLKGLQPVGSGVYVAPAHCPDLLGLALQAPGEAGGEQLSRSEPLRRSLGGCSAAVRPSGVADSILRRRPPDV